MVTKELITKFYDDVEKLGLKFPVAVIAKSTGFSKGNVSDYLNKKKEPSENFLKAFYKAFPNEKSSPIVPQETYTMQSLANLTASNKTLAESNKILAESHSRLVTLVDVTVSEKKGSPLTAESTFADLLVLIAEVGSGKKKWHSTQEGAAELHSRFFGKQGEKKVKNIRSGSDSLNR